MNFEKVWPFEAQRRSIASMRYYGECFLPNWRQAFVEEQLAQAAMTALVETTPFHDSVASGPITIIRSHMLGGPNEFAIDKSDPASFEMPVAWEYPAYVTKHRTVVRFDKIDDFLDMPPPGAGWVLANAGAKAMELTFDKDTGRLFGCPLAENGEYIAQTALRNYRSSIGVPMVKFDRKDNILLPDPKLQPKPRRHRPLRIVSPGCFDLRIAEALPDELRFTTPTLHTRRTRAGHMISFLLPGVDEAKLAS